MVLTRQTARIFAWTCIAAFGYFEVWPDLQPQLKSQIQSIIRTIEMQRNTENGTDHSSGNAKALTTAGH